MSIRFEQTPIIVVLEREQRSEIIDMMRRSKQRFIDKCDSDSLMTIRDWEYGVLLLAPNESRGVDTRFRKDAHVMIMARVNNYHELQQMVGRSSRTRGVSQGSMFIITEDKAGTVLDKLRKCGVISLQGLERLLLILQKRAKDQTLLKELIKLKDQDIHIGNYDQLKQHVSENMLAKLLKGVAV